MTIEIDKLVREIDVYCESAGIHPKTLSRRAVGTATFYDRIKGGGDCTFRIAARIRAYIADNPPPAKEDAA